MRAKRSKVYKKAMALYTSAFKFREPFQVLVDSDFTQRAASQKLDLPARLADILGGQVKIMITQCCIQRLYKAGAEAQAATDLAKTFERRKCNHWQIKETDTECIAGVMGDQNRYNYCVATQAPALRKQLRKVPGVPILFEKRSIILLEPPSDASVGKRAEIEESKLHIPSAELANLKPSTSASASAGASTTQPTTGTEGQPAAAAVSGVDATASLPAATRSTAASTPNTVDALLAKKRKRPNGPKQPNPLSVKKSKKPAAASASKATTSAKANAGAGADKGKGKAKAIKGEGGNKENEAPSSQSQGKKRKLDADDSEAGGKKAKLSSEKKEGQPPAAAKKREKKADPTAGVTRPEGPGTSKKALKRKAKRAAAAAADAGTAGGDKEMKID